MTNYEKYKDELIGIISSGDSISIVNGKPRYCANTNCSECYFGECDCIDGIIEWLNSEYAEPSVCWSKVAVDTPILVSVDGSSWHKRHFAERSGDGVLAWELGGTSWTTVCKQRWQYAKLAEVQDD